MVINNFLFDKSKLRIKISKNYISLITSKETFFGLLGFFYFFFYFTLGLEVIELLVIFIIINSL